METLKIILEAISKPIFFKYIIIIYAGVLVVYATHESFNYLYALEGREGMHTAAIIATIQIPIASVLGFVAKLYWENK
jgi:hypothetical protein